MPDLYGPAYQKYRRGPETIRPRLQRPPMKGSDMATALRCRKAALAGVP